MSTKIVAVISILEQTGPDSFKMNRFSRGFAANRPIQDIIKWAENMGIKNATINDVELYNHTGDSV